MFKQAFHSIPHSYDVADKEFKEFIFDIDIDISVQKIYYIIYILNWFSSVTVSNFLITYYLK